MKKLVFLLLVMIPVIAFSQKAKIEFEGTSHNFGTISESGGNATVDFKFKNTGKVPLILNKVTAGCGCTTPEWSKQPVAPGETGIVKVSYNPEGRPGVFTKSVTVNSNGTPGVVSLTIRGNVTRKPADPYAAYKYNIGLLKIMTNNLYLGIISNTAQVEKEIEIVNTGDKPLNIAVTSPVKYIETSVTPATLAKGGKGVIRVKYLAGQKNDWGFVTDKINVKVNNSEQGEITITATINEDFSKYTPEMLEKAPAITFSEKEGDLGEVAKNSTQTHEFYIENTGKSDLIIRKLKPSETSVSVSTAKSTIKPGKKVKAVATLKTDKETGKKIKIIQFTTNDPKNPVTTYKITANVK